MRFLTAFLIIIGSFLDASEEIPFHSQARQDEFVYTVLYKLLGKQDTGYYLEIGAGEPIHINNTYVFEKGYRWQGLSIDISDNLMPRWYAVRSNTLLSKDATQLDYTSILEGFPQVIDYLSLDVDGNYDTVLRKVMNSNRVFKVITIEHDAYRYGDIYRDKEREILTALGYYLLCPDVSHDGYAFEDWWIHPDFFPADLFQQLKSLSLQGKDCMEVVQNVKMLTSNNMFLTRQALYTYELGIVTMFRNEANYLKEWIEYHHMLGVDHFLLYNDRSEDNWKEVLEPYLRSNLVEVIDWPNDGILSVFPNWQVMAYQDGLKRSKGSTKWIAFIDVDEFILPKKNATILECLNEFFPSASGVYICWRNFGTGGVYINPGEPILSRLTACADRLHPRNASGKSIVKVDDVLIDQLWTPHHHKLRQGAQYYDGSGKPLYAVDQELQVSPFHTSEYVQINHYVMRDENFYQNVRIPRATAKVYSEMHLLLENYESFNASQDDEIIRFLEEKHPAMYQTFWSGK